MTNKEINVAIAEFCGWYRLLNGLWAKVGFHGRLFEIDLPDYSGDLNAMHEAEKVLLSEKGPMAWLDYTDELRRICTSDFACSSVNASPQQKSEALLRVLSKWS